MTGVEILAIEQVATKYAFNWGVWCLFVGVGIVFFAIICVLTGALYHSEFLHDLMIGAFVGLVAGGIIGLLPGFTTKPIEFEDRYKVTITEEVSMVEFMERYEIIDQEGRIYEVREIND